MTRRTLLGVAALAALAGCARADAPAAAAAPAKVRVSITPHLSWGPLMIAQAEGFFKEENIAVEFVAAMRSEESLAALITGDIDVRPGPLHAGFLSAIAQGAKVRIAAGQGHLAPDGCTYYAIVLRPGLVPSKTMRITRMRASQDGATRYVVSRMLAPHGVDLDAIETIRLPEAVMVMSLERGSIDAVAVSEPALTRTAKVGTLWIRAQDAVPNFQWGVIAFGERLLYREPDVGVRFIRAYNRGVERYREGKTDRNVAIIAAATGETEAITREACWPTFRSGSGIDWESIAQFQRWANSEGLMEHTLSRERVWDSTFVTSSAARTDSTTP
ncbi:MAG TPA: ABC transporter substrate-binding protein [Gemmatimonadaceae bacterium]|nr:ABC transporter substrate-binding protein [Gemmatimonadaceae bacterium]